MISDVRVFTSYTTAMIALEEAIKQGWRLDANNPPSQIGFAYELPLIRDDEPPKSRAEILEAARAAKAAKKADQ